MRIELSQREIEVAALVAKGMKDVEISKMLFISRRRVGEIIASIKQKFNIQSRVQIGILAYQRGLVEFNYDLENVEVLI
ncbi:NarL family two-component system response regulator LiaR [Metabacillus crassostreae]|uniref:response regulator transcription factor n=1 Tax=Metabacillus crassostreae TaxID=929098 RepID=UPI00195E05D2|nr:helix-turn-helix transcriptional regulator [Metabacillus crassostreae]MBM7606637.1 NarL family two-component system response regulator LiaR [Metabacillus crassostreae]